MDYGKKNEAEYKDCIVWQNRLLFKLIVDFCIFRQKINSLTLGLDCHGLVMGHGQISITVLFRQSQRVIYRWKCVTTLGGFVDGSYYNFT